MSEQLDRMYRQWKPEVTVLKPNLTLVEMPVMGVGLVRMWFSYNTMIGFQTTGQEVVVVENVYSTTTGKHLNYIHPEKKGRVKEEKFRALWLEAVVWIYKEVMRSLNDDMTIADLDKIRTSV